MFIPRRAPRLVLGALCALTALVGTVSGASGDAPLTGPVHPSVYEWAAGHPGESVPVIVRVAGRLDAGERTLVQHGASIEHRLELINALSGQVPARVLDDLAQDGRVALVTLDAPVVSTGTFQVSDAALVTTFQETIGASGLWETGLTGRGVGVAVVDTGISKDLQCEFATTDENCGGRIAQRVATNPDASAAEDGFGHGSHIATTIGSYSYKTDGQYAGVAPQASLISVKIDDDAGNSTVGDVIAGLGWISEHRAEYNIRVVNLSLSSSVAQSYKVDPLDAAVELLSFNGITVVVAAGNSPAAYSYAPANDPFVITVGATDENGTPESRDDTIAPWSSRGVTDDGFAKPEVYAPGVNIVAGISPSSMIATAFPGGVVREDHNAARYRMSGTSMATAVVSGAAALLLEAHPDWTPGQVKQALMSGASPLAGEGAGQIRVDTALLASPDDASAGIVPSYLLLDAAGVCDTTTVLPEDCPVEFEKISWGSIEFNKISWSKISWSKISWSKISWGSVDYSKISWSKISWGATLD